MDVESQPMLGMALVGLASSSGCSGCQISQHSDSTVTPPQVALCAVVSIWYCFKWSMACSKLVLHNFCLLLSQG